MNKSTWIRSLVYAIIILITPLLAYYLIYVQAREETLLNRTYSHLTNMTARTEMRFNSVFTVVKNACKRPENFANEIINSDLGFLPVTSDRDCEIGSNIESIRSAVILTPERLRITIEAGDDGSKSSRAKAASKAKKIILDLNPRELVGEIDTSDRFYDIFIFDADGNVIYQKNPGNGRIDNISVLKAGQATIESEGILLKDSLNSIRTEFRGRWFLMPSQPLQIDFNNAGQMDQWSLVGLVEERSFNAEKHQFNSDTAVFIALIVAVIVLVTPLIKLWHLGRFDTFKKFDVVLLTASGVTLTSLLTIIILQIHIRYGMDDYMRRQLDSDVGSISSQLETDLIFEIRKVLLQLELVQEKMENVTKSLTLKSGHCEKSGEQEKYQVAGSLLKQDSPYQPNIYPYFNQVYLMDRLGCQLVKWATVETPTNRNSFGDREYFLESLPSTRVGSELFTISRKLNTAEAAELRILLSEETMENAGEDVIPYIEELEAYQEVDRHLDSLKKVSFFLQFITSRTTGEQSIVLSKPVSDSLKGSCLGIGESGGEGPCVAVMSTSIFRAFQAVLPFGFGFAVVNREGDIRYHYEGSSNSEINLPNELGDGTVLRAALDAGSRSSFVEEYQGSTHQFSVRPLEISGSGLSLVTFYSKNASILPILESAGVALFAWIVWFTVLFSLSMGLWQWHKFSEGKFLRKLLDKLHRFDNLLLLTTPFVIVACYFFPALSLLAPIWIVPILLIWLFRRSGTIHARSFLNVAICSILMLITASLPAIGLVRLLQNEALSGFIQLHIMDFNRKTDEQRLTMRQWINSRETDQTNADYGAFRQDGYSAVHQANRYAQIWPQYPLFPMAELMKDECLSNSGKDGFYVEASEADPGVGSWWRALMGTPAGPNLWRSILGNLPDYSDETFNLHEMYRSPRLFRVIGNDSGATCDLNSISEKFQSSYLYNFRNSPWGIGFACLLIFILSTALWYIFIRTLGLRSEKYLCLNEYISPAGDRVTREIIFGLGDHRKSDLFGSMERSQVICLDMRVSTAEQIDDAVNLLSSTASSDEAAVNSGGTLVIDHFDDGLIDRQTVESRVSLLERLVRLEHISVLILMTVDSLTFVTTTHNQEEVAPLNARLASLLAQFDVSYYEDRPFLYLDEESDENILREECRHPKLQHIYDSISTLIKQNDLDDNEIILAVKVRAIALYQDMWNLCTHAEKIMLVDLAHENLVNPNNWDVARQLMQRNYLRRDPFYRIFNTSFKQFIVEKEQVESIASWRLESGSNWKSIRAPLMLLVLGAIGFFAVTQPSFVNSIFAFAAAGAASLPFLVNLIMARIKSNSG